MIEETITLVPKNVKENYPDVYDSDCEIVEGHDSYYQAYRGKGIALELHPLSAKISFKGCGNCLSDNVKVIYAHYHIHKHSGDENWSYELHCNDCNKYTNRFFYER